MLGGEMIGFSTTRWVIGMCGMIESKLVSPSRWKNWTCSILADQW